MTTSATAGADTTESIARALYSLPRDRFVAERNARAQELAKSGDKEGAAAVKALAKPTLLAWAIDQAVQARPDDAEALMETIAGMQSPDSVKALRTLAQRHEELVARLAHEADAAAGGGKVADLAAAIRVAALSADAQRFIDGTLAETPRAGEDTLAAALAAGASVAPRARPERATKQPASKPEPEPEPEPTTDEAATEQAAREERKRIAARRRELRDAISAAREASREATSELRAAEREVTRLERELDRARRQVESAEQARSDADAAVSELRDELAALDD